MNIFNTIIRSWQFLIHCFKFFSRNKDLLFFPIISLIFSGLLLFIIFAGGIIEIEAVTRMMQDQPWFAFIAFVCLYFIFSFIIVYFNASLIACATLRLQGKEASVGDGLGLAATRWWPLLQWTIINTSIGLILRALENSHSIIEDVIASLLGIAWTVSTYFVIPILVFENMGPFHAIKRGFSLFGKGWRRVLSIFLIFNLFFITIAAIVFGLNYLMPNEHKLFIELGVGLFLMLILLSATVGSAFNGIVNSALYLSYAQNQQPQGFDPELLKSAFAQKRR